MDTDDLKLDDHLVGIFVLEMHNQMKLARFAASHIDHFLGTSGAPVDALWYHVENHVKALVAMANILWTTNKNNPYKRRSRLLRERFGLSDENPPADLRDTRNWFEHFDEKIDDWWRESDRHNFSDRNVMPSSSIVGLDTSDNARLFDPTTCDLSVFGRSVNLNAMHLQMETLLQRILDETRDIAILKHLAYEQ